MVFDEISRFRTWAKENYPEYYPSSAVVSWEGEYPWWNELFSSFSVVVGNTAPDDYSEQQLRELIYIIARDHEDETLIDLLTENMMWFDTLCELSLDSDESQAKWQFAANLRGMGDRTRALRQLLALVCDEDEYTSRRALVELPWFAPERVELFAKLFWERNICEEQRIAALSVLDETDSPRILGYIAKARQDGRERLVACADRIERRRLCGRYVPYTTDKS